ncbi:hypothetical protein DAPPUDRAFT_101321 [Daphnia pulex]|uniref:Uncharacterized protein n=1 Tax=Daphnia pulex TaxID=6669 RepID=E9GD10_DAPPU|nr:hypothetical protein DAPPUDRAFT_101321 [Daphnia pulex]|eukprot:EFX82652.1 hypothetical protein DAPPUDRAFT_101321 [Daphnia pulex]
MQRLLRVFIMNISVCFLEKIPTDILESMLDLLLDRRGTSTNVLLHPYLQDVRSYSFTASALLMLLHVKFSCFTGQLVHFNCCDKPAITHQGIMARFICRGDVEKTDTKNVASVSKMSAANHHLLLVICFVLVNPLAATPLFPHVSSVARAALFGLVVYLPRGRTVAPAPDSPKGPVRQCTIGTSPLVDTVMDSRGCAFHLLPSPCQPGLVSNGKSHLGHGSF